MIFIFFDFDFYKSILKESLFIITHLYIDISSKQNAIHSNPVQATNILFEHFIPLQFIGHILWILRYIRDAVQPADRHKYIQVASDCAGFHSRFTYYGVVGGSADSRCILLQSQVQVMRFLLAQAG